LVGWFEAALQEGFTSVQGRVESAPTPLRVPALVSESGACRFYRPPTLFCDPACAGGTTCTASGTCVEAPTAVFAGEVSVTGLSAPVEMAPSMPPYFYSNTGTLPHPGYAEGSDLVLYADGADAIAPFVLDVLGVAPLVSPATSVPLVRDQVVALTWTAPASGDASTVHVDLNIAQHGGTPGWIECEVADTGNFSLPVALTNQLLDQGASGFPSLIMTRRSVDSADTAGGCVQWSAQSAVTLTVDIDGLTSCSEPADCTPPETCQGDLTCG
jgi:hypothetical protein